MKRNIFLILASLIVIGSLAACSAVPAVSSTAAQVRTLSSNGEGEVYLVPDIAYVYVGVKADADDVATALSNNNVQANDISTAVQALGVEAKDIQTASFNVYPMQDYAYDGTISRSYYVVENTVYITVRDLTTLGTLLDAVVKSGANTINGITFDVANKDEAVAQARDLAIEKAMSEAEAIATASGVRLGDIQSISVYTNNYVTTTYDAKGGGGGMTAEYASVPVSAGQLLITANASITYILK